MIEKFINETVSEHRKELFGLINGHEKVIINITKLISHPVLETNFFSHQDKEKIINKFQTVEALISSEGIDHSDNGFLNLVASQTEYLLDDFNELYKFKDQAVASYANENNKLTTLHITAGKSKISVEQHTQIMLNRIECSIESLMDVTKQFNKLYEAVNKIMPPFIENIMTRVNDELVSFRRLRNIADNARTENIYNNAVDKYRELEKNYRLYFYIGIAIILFLSVGLLTLKQDLVPYLFSTIEFWAVKASILLVGITLISYFLKQSTHYQRLADQNYQTQVELQAYPSFMESIPTEEAASVRKELALKYFGREIDGAAHKDMSNIISDQMKSTTEMVKATTEAIKNLKG
ncbi:hypothetical protein KWD59_05810 [Acinetobacter baumannii]|uniref:hypothetical protein n=1 Tax=Acinetobacter baumannii TaxID=470 RepID=UPI002DBD5218|nr:hypothetical protein [Acinetobacter baumannii]MEB6638495.1 hypothetical protein [Acinetobacter baumannii]